MSQLILEFPLAKGDVVKSGTKLSVDLGNGVRLTTGCPEWVEVIHQSKLQLIMEIDGSPHNDKSGETPVK